MENESVEGLCVLGKCNLLPKECAKNGNTTLTLIMDDNAQCKIWCVLGTMCKRQFQLSGSLTGRCSSSSIMGVGLGLFLHEVFLCYFGGYTLDVHQVCFANITHNTFTCSTK